MRWEQQAGQQVGDGAGLPNWALLTTQAHKQHRGWESSSSRLQKQRWPQLPQPRSRKISGGTTVCEVSHQVSPPLISFSKALSRSWNNMKRIAKVGKGREGRVQPSLGERVLPRPPVLTHPPLDHGHGQGCPITTNASSTRGTYYSLLSFCKCSPFQSCPYLEAIGQLP